MPRIHTSTLLLLVVSALGMVTGPASAAEPTTDALAVATSMNRFSWELYGQVRATPGNVFLSPFSIYTALCMTSMGSAGQTAAGFATVLHQLPDEQAHHRGAACLAQRYDHTQGYELVMANRLFGREGGRFTTSFLDNCRDIYGAPLETVVFPEPGRTRINGWVEERTRSHITNLIPVGGVDGATALVLVNAVYFKGTWATPFAQSQTTDALFTVSEGKTVTVPFMARTGDLYMSEIGKAWLVELPYAGNDLAMDLIIPKANDGLASIESMVDAESLRTALDGLGHTAVELFLPRFTLRWGTTSLNKPLISLGLRSAFKAADFSRLSADPLAISDVLHQAFVAVDEQGTVAAAATAVVMRATATAPISIRADHPFLFLIRDLKTKAVLFIGRMTDPS